MAVAGDYGAKSESAASKSWRRHLLPFNLASWRSWRAQPESEFASIGRTPGQFGVPFRSSLPGSMADPRVLVTGGLGFVGSAIVRQIRDLHPEWTIIVLDQHPGPQHEDSWEFEYTQADITSPASVCHAFQQTRPQVVIHTAGVVPPLSER